MFFLIYVKVRAVLFFIEVRIHKRTGFTVTSSRVRYNPAISFDDAQDKIEGLYILKEKPAIVPPSSRLQRIKMAGLTENKDSRTGLPEADKWGMTSLPYL